MEIVEELRSVGPGRYRVEVRLPWGREVPAEMLVGTWRGWSRRPEASDASWTAFEVGPAVVAVRLLEGAAPESKRSPMREAVGVVAGR